MIIRISLLLNIIVMCMMLSSCSIQKNQQNKTTQNNDSPQKKLAHKPNAQNQWVNIQHGLWQSKKTGELAIKGKERINDYGKQQYRDTFIIYLGIKGVGNELKIKDVIDRRSFRQTSDQIYQDKNKVYYHRVHLDGGYLFETEMDTNTLKMIGQCYAQDKNGIHYISGSSGVGRLDVDEKSFKTCFGCGCTAKDKSGIYLSHKKIDKNDFTQEEFRQLFSVLEGL